MDKISIIIPVYNVEKYIAECLESVINQTYSNLEIICIDDCGSDNSMKIVQEYADKDNRIKIIRHEENSGLAPARNTGLNNADGDYILFLDSDDYLMPDIIQKMYDKIKSTDLDFVNSSSKAFADNPNDKALVKKSEKAYLDYKGFDGYKVTLDNLEQTLLKLQCLAWGKMFKTKFLKENNIKFINENVTFEDNGFFLKILSCMPKFSTLRDIGIMYRINSYSLTANMDRSGNRQKKMAHVNAVMKDALEYIGQKANGEKIIKIIKNSGTYDWYFDYQKTKLQKMFKFSWGRHNKNIIILGIPFVRCKMLRNNKKILRIIGIPLSYSNIDNSVL